MRASKTSRDWITLRCLEHQRLCDAPQASVGFGFAGIAGNSKQPGQNADNVAIENRLWLVEGNAADSAGGVAADSGQIEKRLEVLRHLAVVLFDN